MRWINLFVLILLSCFSANAQSETGWIRGTVSDAVSAVDGVEVIVVDSDGVRVSTAMSDASGGFLLSGVKPGEYELILRKEGVSERRIPVRIRAGCETVLEFETGNSVSMEHPPSAFWTCAAHLFDRWRLDRLPAARNIWSLLQNQDPSSVTSTIDEGGFQTGI